MATYTRKIKSGRKVSSVKNPIKSDYTSPKVLKWLIISRAVLKKLKPSDKHKVPP
jgi:hypothetical protein